MVKMNDGSDLILFSYFQMGLKASMFGFSTKRSKEVVQLAGASFFVHQYVPKTEEHEKDDQSMQIIVFCPNKICARTITTKKQF